MSKTALKRRLKNVNSVFEDFEVLHCVWTLPDMRLTDEVRVSLSEKVVPAYKKFLEKSRSDPELKLLQEKNVKYSPQELEALVLEKLYADTEVVVYQILGPKIIRLHFNPAPYKGFKRLKDLFNVEADPSTLLSNFSASLTADVGLFYQGVLYKHTRKSSIQYSFSSENSESYAYINGIEIISVPVSLSYFNRGYDGGGVLQVVGEKSPVNVDNSTALEMIHQQNIKQESDSSTSGMFGKWENANNRKTNNITWRVPVDVGFRYLVRLHFSKLGYKMAETAGMMFRVYINEMIANTNNIGTLTERSEDNSIPWFRDYIVMIKGHRKEGKRDLLICLQTNDEFNDGYGPLKSFEIMRLSNLENSLASPNPLASTRDSLDGTIQNLLRVLDHRNAVATELQLAIRDFSDAHLIGRGGFGKVYKGVIDNGQETVAIKRLKSNSKQEAREFLTEIETLTELRHVNLVSLIGYCNDHGEMILVYEYMAGGTLADHLYKLARNNDNIPSLTWKQRLNISIGDGRGLDYLHTGHSIIHRDVKASNILLDENFIAKFSDFGLAKHEDRSKSQSHVTTNLKGTFGYFDPYYFTTRKLTRKSDTYAFGVVLLEVLCGRPALDTSVAEDEQVLTKWARDNISKGKIDRIVASTLRGEISEDSLKAFAEVAEKCLHDEPKKRPTMAQVVLQLEFALEQQDNTKPPVPNRITSDVDDNIRPSNDEETNLSVGTGEHTTPTTDVQNLAPAPKEQTKNKVVNAEPSERKDKPSRLWPWDTFWNRNKPSTKNELSLTGYQAKEKTQKEEKTINLHPIAVPAIPEDELKKITDNFGSKSIIFEGSYGRVHNGVLRSGQATAVKKLDSTFHTDQEFLEKVSKISSLKHDNVVELLGYCVGQGLRVLAYEYAPNGSLHDILHGRKGVYGAQPNSILSWAQRVKIALAAAKGLEYLHEKAQPCVIHSDFKSSSVLLFDDGDVVKITYDSLSEALDMFDDLVTRVIPRTHGYHAPECVMSGQRSSKSDVYSYGIVLVELLTGRKPLDYTRPRGQQNLVTWATPKLGEDKVKHCVDARLNGEYPPKAVAKMAAVAALCVQYEAEFRPNMSIVARNLIVHNHPRPLESNIAPRVDKLAIEHPETQCIVSLRARQLSLPQFWSPSPLDWFKFKSDAAFVDGHGACAFVVRNSKGEVLFAAARILWSHHAS
ncbi:hypothetical protein BUALT_Bualt07G0012900 [Buddleja alternifolia]|uniref:Protein kinase domain-containing protein n=1 Tax=Buddleja alternifolia TaxID=168488 RepID=A0AAV6X704_9LAMI|nr:hypothetical protein BUALT_Bualt07G0012900 [Buddleja alternifolia]